MKLIVLAILVAPIASAMAQTIKENQVVKLSEHKGIFEDFTQCEALKLRAVESATVGADDVVNELGGMQNPYSKAYIVDEIDRYSKKFEEAHGRPVGRGIWYISLKSEFESEADYENRIKVKSDEIEVKQKISNTKSAEMRDRAEMFSKSLRNKTVGLEGFSTVVSLVMGPYDAESNTVTFSSNLTIIGSYDERIAVIKVQQSMPPANIPVALAKQLRHSSDRKDLFGLIRFKTPELYLAHEFINLPSTKGEDLAHLGVALGSYLSGVEIESPDVWKKDANIIYVSKFSEVKYLGFFNSEGEIK